MKHLFAFALLALLVLSPAAFAEETGTTGSTGAAGSAYGTSVTGSATISAEVMTQKTCDPQTKPRLSCPAGYSVGCNEAAGYKWTCIKSSASSNTTTTTVVETSVAPTPGATSNTGVEPDEIDVSATGGTSAGSGGGGGGAGKVIMQDASMTAESNPKLGILLDPAVQAAIYIKIDGVKGESSAKGGNVEFEWKVEEGESAAAADYFLKIPPIDGESSGGVNVAAGDVNGDGMAEGGEKGGTEDINIGVGEAKSKEIVIDGVKVRALSEDQKAELRNNAPKTAADVKTEADLALFVAAAAADGMPMEQVSFNFSKIEVKYQAQGKLLGFIPHTYVLDATLDADADGNARVKVKLPWYSFLLSTGLDVAGLETEAAAHKDHKNWIDVASLSSEASMATKAAAYAQAFSAVAGSLDTAVKGSWNLKENVK